MRYYLHADMQLPYRKAGLLKVAVCDLKKPSLVIGKMGKITLKSRHSSDGFISHLKKHFISAKSHNFRRLGHQAKMIISEHMITASSSAGPATPDVADSVCDVGSSGPCGGRWIIVDYSIFYSFSHVWGYNDNIHCKSHEGLHTAVPKLAQCPISVRPT